MSETNGSRKRKSRTAAEKLRIVLAGMQADMKVAELCRREGITATQYYQWRDRLRASLGFYNDSRDVDRFLGAVARIVDGDIAGSYGVDEHGEHHPRRHRSELVGVV